MPQYFTGDELGTVKSIRYSPPDRVGEWKSEVTHLLEGGAGGKARAVQKLTVSRVDSETLLTAARADGSIFACRTSGAAPELLHEWKETRLKSGQKFIGLALSNRRVYSCTSNGALRLTQFGQGEAPPTSEITSLPMRLSDWRIAPDKETFAYGGEEVELSVWRTEDAFGARAVPSGVESKKRKRGDMLLPGEVWRAKNVANDNLDLRQPVHITTLTYLSSSSSSSYHLITGTQSGSVRRYDTRAARRPVADWKHIAKAGGISQVEAGFSEHELFVADQRCDLSALDLRNGKTIYSYKALAGAVTSLAPSPGLLASVSQDRFLRLHSTYTPPEEVGQQQSKKGEVLDKVYMKVTPTFVAWDQNADLEPASRSQDDDEDQHGVGDDVWANMEDVESDNESGGHGTAQHAGKKSRPTK
ncbi:WD40-repeat-containing domain protein [Sparassis latifolia]|uniref:Ribosome biogenesis protein NSA1 n=1 Tax=Sparassis crispa TaxID=139825 RepID=A0A401GJL1_9APHY|nr:WD repeat-containing protein [Sparassis crispa]GBE82339.1 WD repeat-containing protein [Sparassis crispa]